MWHRVWPRWDKFCAGCPECGNLDRTFETLTHEASYLDCGGVGCKGDCNTMCDIINDDKRSPHVDPVWKNETRSWAELCNWGPCHGCGECLTAAAEVSVSTASSGEASQASATTQPEAAQSEGSAQEASHTADNEEAEHEAEERKAEHEAEEERRRDEREK